MITLKEPIIEANKRIAELRKEMINLEDFVQRSQRICQHDWQNAGDLYDHHKRVEYQRCAICELVR